MSHVEGGPLAAYNSLQDPHLRGFFGNDRMRKHLKKAGLVTRKGHLVSEQTFRLNNAKREHKKHVRDMLAQAIVHKTLDMERHRQVQIREKLEEIAKAEMVRKVRSERGRSGDEDVLPYLSPRARSRGNTRPSTASGGRQLRPKSAPGHSRYSDDEEVVFVNGDGEIVDPERRRSGEYEVDSKHLYALNRTALEEYHLAVNGPDTGRRAKSPYTTNQATLYSPTPPRGPRAQRGGRQGRARSVKPTTTAARNRQRAQSAPRNRSLHREEAPKSHSTPAHSNALMRFKYMGMGLENLAERDDPRDEIVVEQQHCGGNTLRIFHGRLMPNETFEFMSKRHRGYPLGLTFYVNGRSDIVMSSCCEKKHRVGTKMGLFKLVGLDGAAACYRCVMMQELRAKERRRRRAEKKRDGDDPDAIVSVEGDSRKGDPYEDDFEKDDDDQSRSSRSGSHSSRRSRSRSPSASSSGSERRRDDGVKKPQDKAGSYEDDFEKSSDDESRKSSARDSGRPERKR